MAEAYMDAILKAVLLASSFAACCSQQGDDSSPTHPKFFDGKAVFTYHHSFFSEIHQIPFAGFVKGEQLVLFDQNATDPETYAFWLKTAYGYSQVTGLKDLKGHVCIKDGKTALQYVALFTTPDYWGYFPPYQVEVHASKEADKMHTPLKEDESYWDGALPRHLIRELHAVPVVSKFNGGFLIKRVVFRHVSAFRGDLLKTQEFVGPAGEYRELGSWIIRPDISKLMRFLIQA